MRRNIISLGLAALLLAVAMAVWGSMMPGQLSVKPSVTINQAARQLDPTSIVLNPTNGALIHFTVVFSQAVNDFATGDVTLGGTAPGELLGTVTGSGSTYDVAVTGMTGSGTVIASVAAGVAHDYMGNANTSSTSTDNTVTYYGTPPTITPIANQLINRGTSTAALPFTVGDVLTPPALLKVSRASSNLTLAPTANIALTGPDANGNCSVTVTPYTTRSGVTTITLTVMDIGRLTAQTSFIVTVNGPPTITAIDNQLINRGASTAALAFTVGDDLTPPALLTVTGVSSNTALIHAGGIVLTGPDEQGNCTVQVTPVATYSGITIITLTVMDAGGLTARTSFTLRVNAPPTITAIANQRMLINTAPPALAFTVGDDLTPVASLTVTGVSNNTTLVPNANIVFGGAGAARTVTVTPAAGQLGAATITLTVKDGSGLTATTSFTVTVTAVNAPPTITLIANQLIFINTATAALPFTVGDDLTPVALLTVTGASNNTTLVPTANIVFGGAGAARTVTVTPAAGQLGVATITLTVKDGGGLTATTRFTVTVTAVNAPPTITAIADQSVSQGTATAALPFTVGDDITPAALLTLTGASSNTTLVPIANIIFGGVGAARTVTVTPAAGQIGTATITLTVKDGGGLTTSTSFTVTVSVNLLGSAITFGAFGSSAGMTNQGINTVIHGNIGTTGASTTITGFHDSVGDIYTETLLNVGNVTGRIYTAAPPPGGAGVGGNAATFLIAQQALADANTAFLTLKAMPTTGSNPGANLAGQTLAPGVYTAPSGSFMIQGGDLTLDAGGNADAVFVFQMATTLTVGGPGAAFPQNVILAGGAQAKNVYWQVGTSATINAAGGGTMVGTIIAGVAVSISTAGNDTIATLNGRAIGLTASVTVVNTVINLP